MKRRLLTTDLRVPWLGWILLVLLLATAGWAEESFKGLYISELSADNRQNLHDRFGNHPPWIEIFNGGAETVDLAGWFLSDTATNLTKWRFPHAGILSGGYFVVYASGDGKTSVTNELPHPRTNFRLNQEGGYLALVGPGTNVVSELAYPKSSPDVSYGRVSGEPALAGPFSEPTPGKPNQSSGPGFAPQVAFSRPSGSFEEPFMLNLSSTNAVIRYSLDGSPSAASPIYQAPLSVTNTTCLRARAYQEGRLPGPPQSETYILVSSNLARFKSNLPVVVMDTLGTDRATSARSELVHLSFYEPVEGKTSLTSQPSVTTRAGFHQRGSSSTGMPQPAFAMEFLDEFNREQHLPLLGLPANSDWVLYAPTPFDPIMIHNPFIHTLSREMGHYSPRTRFVEVFLAQHPGPITTRDYFGVYVLEEKIKVGKHRVAIDRLGPDDLQPPEVTGGYLLKFDREGPGENGLWAGGVSMVYVEPKEPVIELPQRAPQREYLKAYFEEFQRVLQSSNWKDLVHGYRAYIDVDSWIDFHVLEVLSGNVDIFRFSTFFYKPRGGKITFGPHWDFDRALGSPDHRDADPNRWNTGRFFDGPWWNRLFTDPDFWQLWVDRWQGLRQTNFSESHLFGLIDRLTDEVRPVQPREARRWGLEPRGDSYQSEIDWMKSWLSQRISFIDQQLVQPPQLSRSQESSATPGAFKMTLRGPENATLYYTLDGSDPRLTQGAISPNAIVYSGPISLHSDAHVVARAYNTNQRQTRGPPISTPWSSSVSTNY